MAFVVHKENKLLKCNDKSYLYNDNFTTPIQHQK